MFSGLLASLSSSEDEMAGDKRRATAVAGEQRRRNAGKSAEGVVKKKKKHRQSEKEGKKDKGRGKETEHKKKKKKDKVVVSLSSSGDEEESSESESESEQASEASYKRTSSKQQEESEGSSEEDEGSSSSSSSEEEESQPSKKKRKLSKTKKAAAKGGGEKSKKSGHQKSSKSSKWTDAEELLLCKLERASKLELDKSGGRGKTAHGQAKTKWEGFEAEFALNSYTRSAKEICSKWQNIATGYRQVRDFNSKTGNAPDAFWNIDPDLYAKYKRDKRLPTKFSKELYD